MMIELRKLKLRDLGSIEEIERASYPTPWSRSMFAGELAKPSSICLGAVDSEQDELVGYLIISRYVDAWHVMNIAVAPAYRRKGIARALMERLFEVTERDARRGYTLEEHGAEIPPDDDERHIPLARFHVQLAGDFGPAERVEPIYLRIPDAEKTLA